jgi:hypothetical protein
VLDPVVAAFDDAPLDDMTECEEEQREVAEAKAEAGFTTGAEMTVRITLLRDNQ